MPRPNVEIVLRLYDALARNDAAAVAALAAPEIEVHQSTELPWGGDFAGLPGAMRFLGNVSAFLDFHLTVERTLDAGDSVAVIGRTSGTVRATGTPFDVMLVHLWELRDGKVTRLSVHLDNLAILPGVICELPAAA